MEPEGSSPRSQGLATPCPEPDRVFPKHQSNSGAWRVVAWHAESWFLRRAAVSISPNTEVGVIPCRLSATAYSLHSGGFLHTQPEDASWRGDRDPYITGRK